MEDTPKAETSKDERESDASSLYTAEEIRQFALNARESAQELATAAGSADACLDVKVWGIGTFARARYELAQAIQNAVDAFDLATGTPSARRETPCEDCRKELLVKYARRPMKEFLQIDGWGDGATADCVIDPSRTGLGMMAGVVRELMHGPEVVRILIPRDAPKEKVLAQLDRAKDWIASAHEELAHHRSGYCYHAGGGPIFEPDLVAVAGELTKAIEEKKRDEADRLARGEEIPF